MNDSNSIPPRSNSFSCPASKGLILQWARFYRDRFHYIPVAIDPGSKFPYRKRWNTETGSDDELDHLVEGGNLGIRLGEPSAGLLNVDLDCDVARELARFFLPETSWTSGHLYRDSHWWYTGTGELPKLRQLKHLACNSGRAMCVELRSTGQLAVVPPSLHPESSLHYDWADRDALSAGPPREVDGADLNQRVGWLHAACLLRPLWSEGQRHEVSLALAGTLLRGGIAPQHAEQFYRRLCSAFHDEESRVKDLRTTAKRLERGEAVSGLPRLRELVGEERAAKLAQALELRDVTTDFEDEGQELGLDPSQMGIHGTEEFFDWKRSRGTVLTLYRFLQPGRLHLLHGPSNVGKTSLLLWAGMKFVLGEPPDPALEEEDNDV